jgi:hypothetical protein
MGCPYFARDLLLLEKALERLVSKILNSLEFEPHDCRAIRSNSCFDIYVMPSK